MVNKLAERFGESLSDYADMSSNIAGRLVRMAKKCDDTELLTRINLLLKYIGEESKRIKRNLEGNMEKSNCCKAMVIVDSADEGTSCWRCTKCGEACDVDTSCE